MQYGFFDDAAKEYVITRPDTPLSWSNYLGNREYGAVITNNAGGYSFFRSGAKGRFLRLRFNSIPMDQPGGRGKCVVCGGDASEKVYFARAY